MVSGGGPLIPRGRSKASHLANKTHFPLSDALKRAICSDEARISLNFKGITEIDSVAERYKKVAVLLLSQNRISSLRGLGQFMNITSLSLSFNEIGSFGQLKWLPFVSLKRLSLEGNPITAHIDYRARLLALCGSLTELDGSSVTRQERDAITQAVELQSIITPFLLTLLLVENMLENMVNRLRVHKDILTNAYGDFSCFVRNLPPREKVFTCACPRCSGEDPKGSDFRKGVPCLLWPLFVDRTHEKEKLSRGRGSREQIPQLPVTNILEISRNITVLAAATDPLIHGASAAETHSVYQYVLSSVLGCPEASHRILEGATSESWSHKGSYRSFRGGFSFIPDQSSDVDNSLLDASSEAFAATAHPGILNTFRGPSAHRLLQDVQLRVCAQTEDDSADVQPHDIDWCFAGTPLFPRHGQLPVGLAKQSHLTTTGFRPSGGTDAYGDRAPPQQAVSVTRQEAYIDGYGGDSATIVKPDPSKPVLPILLGNVPYQESLLGLVRELTSRLRDLERQRRELMHARVAAQRPAVPMEQSVLGVRAQLALEASHAHEREAVIGELAAKMQHIEIREAGFSRRELLEMIAKLKKELVTKRSLLNEVQEDNEGAKARMNLMRLELCSQTEAVTRLRSQLDGGDQVREHMVEVFYQKTMLGRAMRKWKALVRESRREAKGTAKAALFVRQRLVATSIYKLQLYAALRKVKRARQTTAEGFSAMLLSRHAFGQMRDAMRALAKVRAADLFRRRRLLVAGFSAFDELRRMAGEKERIAGLLYLHVLRRSVFGHIRQQATRRKTLAACANTVRLGRQRRVMNWWRRVYSDHKEGRETAVYNEALKGWASRQRLPKSKSKRLLRNKSLSRVSSKKSLSRASSTKALPRSPSRGKLSAARPLRVSGSSPALLATRRQQAKKKPASPSRLARSPSAGAKPTSPKRAQSPLRTVLKEAASVPSDEFGDALRDNSLLRRKLTALLVKRGIDDLTKKKKKAKPKRMSSRRTASVPVLSGLDQSTERATEDVAKSLKRLQKRLVHLKAQAKSKETVLKHRSPGAVAGMSVVISPKRQGASSMGSLKPRNSPGRVSTHKRNVQPARTPGRSPRPKRLRPSQTPFRTQALNNLSDLRTIDHVMTDLQLVEDAQNEQVSPSVLAKRRLFSAGGSSQAQTASEPGLPRRGALPAARKVRRFVKKRPTPRLKTKVSAPRLGSSVSKSPRSLRARSGLASASAPRLRRRTVKAGRARSTRVT